MYSTVHYAAIILSVCHTTTPHTWAHEPPHHNRFTAFFPGPPRWASARRELLDFMVQGEIYRGRHTDHLAGRHSIRTNQCPPPPSPHIFYGLDALPAAQPTVSKHWRDSLLHFVKIAGHVIHHFTAIVLFFPRYTLWCFEGVTFDGSIKCRWDTIFSLFNRSKVSAQ